MGEVGRLVQLATVDGSLQNILCQVHAAGHLAFPAQRCGGMPKSGQLAGGVGGVARGDRCCGKKRRHSGLEVWGTSRLGQIILYLLRRRSGPINNGRGRNLANWFDVAWDPAA